MEKHKISVTINGREYAVVSDEPEAYLYRVSMYVDQKIAEIVTAFPRISTTDAAVMAAMTIADELLHLRDEGARLDAKIANALGGEQPEATLSAGEDDLQRAPEHTFPPPAKASVKKDVFIPQKSKKR